MKFFSKLLTVAALIFMFVGAASLPIDIAGFSSDTVVHAATFQDDACKGLEDVGGGGGCGDSGSAFQGIFKTIVRIVSLVIGFLAVIMVLVSGFKYITSGGDAGKVASAKNTLIYALVGVIVAALAQALIQFVLTTSVKTTTKCEGHSYSQSDPRCET